MEMDVSVDTIMWSQGCADTSFKGMCPDMSNKPSEHADQTTSLTCVLLCSKTDLSTFVSSHVQCEIGTLWLYSY